MVPLASDVMVVVRFRHIVREMALPIQAAWGATRLSISRNVKAAIEFYFGIFFARKRAVPLCFCAPNMLLE